MTTTSTTARTWVTGTVVLALVILLGTWFLGASPQLARAAETRATTEQALVTQDALRLRLAELREQSENLDVYRAQLAAVREHVPVTADLAGYVDRLDALAAEHGVALTGVLPGTPAAVVAPVPAQPAPAPAAEAPATSGTATAGASAAAPMPGAGLVTVPLSVTATGGYDAVMAFVSALQGDGRLYVVTGLSATSRTPGEVTPGHAPAAPGDVAVTLDGGLLVLPEDVVPVTATQAEGAAETDDATADLPTTARNPFGPVAAG